MIISRSVGFNELWFTYLIEPVPVCSVLNCADLRLRLGLGHRPNLHPSAGNRQLRNPDRCPGRPRLG